MPTSCHALMALLSFAPSAHGLLLVLISVLPVVPAAWCRSMAAPQGRRHSMGPIGALCYHPHLLLHCVRRCCAATSRKVMRFERVLPLRAFIRPARPDKEDDSGTEPENERATVATRPADDVEADETVNVQSDDKFCLPSS